MLSKSPNIVGENNGEQGTCLCTNNCRTNVSKDLSPKSFPVLLPGTCCLVSKAYHMERFRLVSLSHPAALPLSGKNDFA